MTSERTGYPDAASPAVLNGSSAPGNAHAMPARGGRYTYAALDLGTNNCRLLIARPGREGFRIIDAFSRIVRLGEGIGASGELSEGAIRRTLGALAICRDKMEQRGVNRARLIATEACRAARNGPEFLERVRDDLGLELEIIDRQTEAHLAAAGCAALVDHEAQSIVLFDIGGGSTEIVWLARRGHGPQPHSVESRIRAWTSLQLGVVTLSEKFGGRLVDARVFEAMVNHVSDALDAFVEKVDNEDRCMRFHLLGTSGTVTTLAGVHLGLVRYDRRQVDGLWMSNDEVSDAMDLLRDMSYEERAANGCIGHERADLVLAGCAIFEAIRRSFPSDRIRIADRGLREGILMQLMSADRVWRGPPPERGFPP